MDRRHRVRGMGIPADTPKGRTHHFHGEVHTLCSKSTHFQAGDPPPFFRGGKTPFSLYPTGVLSEGMLCFSGCVDNAPSWCLWQVLAGEPPVPCPKEGKGTLGGEVLLRGRPGGREEDSPVTAEKMRGRPGSAGCSWRRRCCPSARLAGCGSRWRSGRRCPLADPAGGTA